MRDYNGGIEMDVQELAEKFDASPELEGFTFSGGEPMDQAEALTLLIEELRRRLVKRATDAPEVIEQRLSKAAYEMTFADQFDKILVNDQLEVAEQEALEMLNAFLDD